MSAQSLVLRGRRLIAPLLVDTGRISRLSGEPAFDTDTGVFTPAGNTTVHEGPCRVRMESVSAATPIFGETQTSVARLTITFPHDIPDVRVDDVVTITESDDPHITTKSFRVTVVPSLTFLMYRELGVEVVE